MKLKMNRQMQCSVALLMLAGHGAVMASCGSAFCSINTDWDAQTPWTENATQLDLRMETINQDQLRAGKDKSRHPAKWANMTRSRHATGMSSPA